MSRKKDSKPSTDISALSVRPGVDARHDGLPGTAEPGTGPVPRRRALSTDEIVSGVQRGDRVLLARAITLVESASPAHQEQAQEVLTRLLPHRCSSLRVGITGVPGAGKSTFIEALGCGLTAQGHKVAVTAVDPSSSITGGSILGDKTRMEQLAADGNAFIRPSPSGGTLGGVARKTRETIILFEAAGYDVILVETVGVGQSEVLVRSMVDFFLLILIAGAGDDLQGIKKGVVEIADAILINKADGAGLQAARAARAEFEQVLHYLRPATEGWQPRAFTSSATRGEGVMEIWQVVTRYRQLTEASGVFQQRRRTQERDWVEALVREGLQARFERHPAVAALKADLLDKVSRGEVPATTAALMLLEAFAQGQD
jgi:LAO/AO transport system kinase|nr:methylmalonyl Co-A mutase-associated GTPase MeaB [Candidatus Krumholzibacteria bacterium]